MFMMIKGYGDHFFGDILLLLMIENYDAGLHYFHGNVDEPDIRSRWSKTESERHHFV